MWYLCGVRGQSCLEASRAAASTWRPSVLRCSSPTPALSDERRCPPSKILQEERVWNEPGGLCAVGSLLTAALRGASQRSCRLGRGPGPADRVLLAPSWLLRGSGHHPPGHPVGAQGRSARPCGLWAGLGCPHPCGVGPSFRRGIGTRREFLPWRFEAWSLCSLL